MSIITSIRIPNRFKEKLEKNDVLNGSVLLSLSSFIPWLEKNEIPFFPDYTDHGVQHLEDVLLSADSLVTDEAHEQMTSEDVATFILSVLLHDCGMHISEDGFVYLVSSNQNEYLINGFKDRSWHDLWLDYLGEASRFDQRKLINIFGDAEPISHPKMVANDMTKRDRLLIGEFLRRHHHRLAHEIAISGVPFDSQDNLKLKAVPEQIADLSGLVARSHGMPIRSCMQYLKNAYDLREFQGVHAVFLMCLLRMSDYLQIQNERAPNSILHVKHIQSPLSRREWNVHQSIRDIRNTHEDPESIFIHATPSDVKTFLRICNLTSDIQKELDMSWAVLGEVYGRFRGLDKFGFVLRRIRSNLDDVEVFANSVSYLPKQVSFDVANPDLLKLLVGPLYGEQWEISFREMVQNSVDAVRELRQYLLDHPDNKDVDLMNQESDVSIKIYKENNETWIDVSDKGIGMTPDILCNYFLKAGASFRRSDAWRTDFEDEKGKATVIRSGRFGVGMLACFLLGDEIYVETRHITMPRELGVSFSANLDTDHIQLDKRILPVGTKIKIRVSGKHKKAM